MKRSGEHLLECGIPWVTKQALWYLWLKLTPQTRVLEFGSGGSSIWFALYCEEIFTFETNREWFDKLQNEIIKRGIKNLNSKYICSNTQEDVKVCDKLVPFDILLVDGEDRESALKHGLQYLKAGGLLVLDNYFSYFPQLQRQVPNWYEWQPRFFYDPDWSGEGTAIFIKPKERKNG